MECERPGECHVPQALSSSMGGIRAGIPSPAQKLIALDSLFGRRRFRQRERSFRKFLLRRFREQLGRQRRFQPLPRILQFSGRRRSIRSAQTASQKVWPSGISRRCTSATWDPRNSTVTGQGLRCSPAGSRRTRQLGPSGYADAGAQVDFRLVLFSQVKSTFSTGFAVAHDRSDHTGTETMFSLKIY